MKDKEYPHWVCQECGSKASGGRQFKVSCWNEGQCEVCGEFKAVTEARDFYYPVFEIEEKEETQDEFDLRDKFALWYMEKNPYHFPTVAYEFADNMIAVRNKNNEV